MRLYRALLHLYPRRFRERFGPEMMELFGARAAAVPRSPGPRLRFWISVVADVAASAWRARVSGGELVSRRPRIFADIALDLRHAARVLARTPAVTLFIVGLMAIGIGGTTAVFGAIHTILLRPLPFPHPERLVLIWERRGAEAPRVVVGAHEFPEWQARNQSFDTMAAFAFDRDFALTGSGEPAVLAGVRVTPDFFRVLQVRPEAGETFGQPAADPNAGDVAVISDRLWRSRFGGDQSIVGRSIHVNDRPIVVVGVMPPSMVFPLGAGGAPPDLWVPITEPLERFRGRHTLTVVARLRDGVSIDRAQADMDLVAGGIATELPQFSAGHGAGVRPLASELVRNVRPVLLLLFAAVALVLVITLCNVANLLLARAAARQQEIAVRIALGAGRLRVARLLVTESTLLAAAGGIGGVLVARWITAVTRTSLPRDVPGLESVTVDPTVFAFAVALTVVTAILFTIAPIAHATRVNVSARLAHGTKGASRPAGRRARQLIVAAEVALTAVVAGEAALFGQSLYRLLHVDPGFKAAGVLAVDLALPPSRYGTSEAQRAFVREALDRIRALPELRAAAATNFLPQAGGGSSIAIAIEGRPPASPGRELSASYRIVTPDYFRTLGMPIVDGRPFSSADAREAVPLIRWYAQQPLPARHDSAQAPPVAVINQAMARAFWPGERAIGRRFTALFSPPIHIIGIVADSRNRALTEDAVPEFYLSADQEPQSRMTLVVDTAGDSIAAAPSIRAVIHALDPDLPVGSARTLDDVVGRTVALQRTTTTVLVLFASVSLVLMTFGVYAVVSYTTALRMHEIGVRIALGAERVDIQYLIVAGGVGTAAVGLVIGLAAAYAIARGVSSLLFGTAPADPLTYGIVSVSILTVAAIASWTPARRAHRADPVRVLRNE